MGSCSSFLSTLFILMFFSNYLFSSFGFFEFSWSFAIIFKYLLYGMMESNSKQKTFLIDVIISKGLDSFNVNTWTTHIFWQHIIKTKVSFSFIIYLFYWFGFYLKIGGLFYKKRNNIWWESKRYYYFLVYLILFTVYLSHVQVLIVDIETISMKVKWMLELLNLIYQRLYYICWSVNISLFVKLLSQLMTILLFLVLEDILDNHYWINSFLLIVILMTL